MEREQQPPLFEMQAEDEATQQERTRPGQCLTGAQSCPASESVQPPGEITFDGSVYHYTGCVLEEGRYVRRSFRFTPDEVDIYASEPLWRVAAMVDATGRDAGRQAEIKRYGKRVWHSPYRQQDACLQGLDYIFRHDVDLVLGCHPFAQALYAGDPAQADRWTTAMFDAYRGYALYGSREPLCRLLVVAGIPLSVLDIGT